MATCGLTGSASAAKRSQSVRRLLWFAVAAGCFISLPLVVEAASVAILLAPHDAYKTAAVTAEKALVENGHRVVVYELPKIAPPATAGATSQPASAPPISPELLNLMKRIEGTKPAVILTIGEQATWAALDNIKAVPVVYSMVTNASDFPVTDKGNPHHSRVAGVTTDILPKTQLQWIAKVQPQARSLGVLFSPRSKRTAEAIRLAGDGVGLSVVLVETSKDEFAKGIEELTRKGCDGLLMIADAQVYNKDTVKPALLWGLRQKKAVWAFSENFVKSGALGGLYTSYEAIGLQTARVAIRVMGGEEASKIGLVYPEQIQKALNERTASMIDLTLSASVLNEATRYGKE